MTTREKGKHAEDLTFKYLQQQGMKPLSRNYTTRCGEIDLIKQDKDCLVFVEVRYKKNHQFVKGSASVDAKKQGKLIRTAQHYLQNNNIGIDTSARFDIISTTHIQNVEDIDWLKNAFTA